MIDETELIKRLQAKLNTATESRDRIRTRVGDGRSHDSHLVYADGLVDGIESAIVAVIAVHHKLTQEPFNTASKS